MSTLMDVQRQFQDYLLTGKNDFGKLIVGTERVSVETRLSIYGSAYRSRLCEALISNYPVLHAYLGAAVFEKMAADYLDQFPSEYRSIRWFGDRFPDFLKQQVQHQQADFLSELAQFEWMQTIVFDAADHAMLRLEEVGRILPEQWSEMRFTLHPSVHRMTLSWNVTRIWQAVFDQSQPDEPAKYASAITWMLWRQDRMNYFRSLTEHETWAVEVMMSGGTFGEVCEGLCRWFTEDDAGVQAGLLLKCWIESGWCVDVVV